MKRILLVLLTAATIAVACSGCSLFDKISDTMDAAMELADSVDEIKKSGRVEILTEGSDEPVAVLETEEEMKDFISQMGLSSVKDIVTPSDAGLKIAKLPKEAEISYICIFYQEETQKAGQDESDLKELEIARMVFYKDIPYLNIEMSSFSLDFQLPETTDSYFESLIQ